MANNIFVETLHHSQNTWANQQQVFFLKANDSKLPTFHWNNQKVSKSKLDQNVFFSNDESLYDQHFSTHAINNKC